MINIIAEAAQARRCVRLVYGGKSRLVEPYSLRGACLVGFEVEREGEPSGSTKSYRLDKVESLEIAEDVGFEPRWAVEL